MWELLKPRSYRTEARWLCFLNSRDLLLARPCTIKIFVFKSQLETFESYRWVKKKRPKFSGWIARLSPKSVDEDISHKVKRIMVDFLQLIPPGLVRQISLVCGRGWGDEEASVAVEPYARVSIKVFTHCRPKLWLCFVLVEVLLD